MIKVKKYGKESYNAFIATTVDSDIGLTAMASFDSAQSIIEFATLLEITLISWDIRP